ncbi:MAG TPA: PHB depolymerase family esterase [Acidimicrobiales bacterium]|nr:PHB depolymerase family esterase [Acidimicrobiales bacterium]
MTFDVGGRPRTVVVHLPAGYRPSSPTPLVLNMHGSGGTAAQQEMLSGMDGTADGQGFIVAYPQAAIPAGGGFDWNVPNVPLLGGEKPPADAPNDVDFLIHLVSDMADTFCVDTHRVFATGLSGGGRMASQLACDASGVVAAVAPVAGLRFPDPCPVSRAVPVVAFHGTADPIDPYQGNGQAYWTYSVPTAAENWARLDHCSATPVSTSGVGYTLSEYKGCSGKATVRLYSLTGAGHEWPGGPQLPTAITKVLGPQSDAVSANSTMWAFFAAHPLP